MSQNTSMIRFLMFMILSLVIFFNLTPQIVNDDAGVGGVDSGSGNDIVEDDAVEDDAVEDDGKYCLVDDGASHEDKKCEKITPDDKKCQNEFSTKEECMNWKDALGYDNDNYTTDDIDKLTIMSSDDMIYCLKNDKSCEQMKFGECRDNHIDPYQDEANCKSAKSQLENNSGNNGLS